MALAAMHSFYWQGTGDGVPGPSVPGYPGWQSTILTTGSNAVLVMPLQITVSPEVLLSGLSVVIGIAALVVAILALRMIRAVAAHNAVLRALHFEAETPAAGGPAPPDELRVIRRYTVFQQGFDGARAAIYSGTDRKLAKRLFTDMAVVPGGEVTCEADGQVLWRRTA